MAPDMVRLNCRASPDINDLIVKIAEGSTGGDQRGQYTNCTNP